MEDELRNRDLDIGIPYWDWSRPNARIPALAADEYYTDPITQEQRVNPFHHAEVAFMGEVTARNVRTF